jgi:NAD(P)-dependent dehydrogenase (short-subunit alcohol dehydrogenase family)
MRLDGKVIIVTGGGSGIGAASATAFAAAGASVVVAGRTLSKVEAIAEQIQADGGQAIPVQADVSSGLDVQQMIATAVDSYGRLDVLFNNAGISPSGTITDITEAEWDQCLDINLKGVFLGAKYAVPHLKAAGGGVILTTAGTFGIRAAKNKAAYSTAKAGAINLTRSIALDYARDHIRANVIAPGVVETPLLGGAEADAEFKQFLDQYQPLPGLTQPDEVASLAVYLASDAARMITGQVFVIDAGQQAGLYA